MAENPEAVWRELMGNKPITIENMQAIAPEMQRRTGAKLLFNADGTKADWQMPDGAVYDAVGAFGGPVEGRTLQWGLDDVQPEGSPYAGQGAGIGAMGMGGGFAVDPATGLPPGYSITPQYGAGPGGAYPLSSFQAPGLVAPFTAPFQRPVVTDDPGFQWRLDQGNKAIERGAAARGTLLSGGTLKDMLNYSQGLASQEYGNAYGRNMQEYLNAYNIYNNNQANAYNRLSGVAGMGQNASAGLGALGANYAANAGNLYQNRGDVAAGGWVDIFNRGLQTGQNWWASQQPNLGGMTVAPYGVGAGVPPGATGTPVNNPYKSGYGETPPPPYQGPPGGIADPNRPLDPNNTTFGAG